MFKLIYIILLKTISVPYYTCFDDINNYPEYKAIKINDIQNKPIGIGLPQVKIEELFEFPPAEEFIKRYVIPQKPVIIRNGAKISPAFNKWIDEYFLALYIPANETVNVEKRKKEERDIGDYQMHFHEFIKIYNYSDIYMVDTVPKYLQNDLVVPCSLRCPEFPIFDALMWYSSGGTAFVLHTDIANNINCLYRGKKEILIIDRKYSKFYHIDNPNGAFSSVNIDAVDYIKYSGLSKVEYINVSTNAGDCVFIPSLFAHQVRSFYSNIAINIWFHHHSLKKLKFDSCDKYCKNESRLNEIKLQGINHPGVTFQELQTVMMYLFSSTEDYKPKRVLDIPKLFVDEVIATFSECETRLLSTYMTYIVLCLDTNNDGYLTQLEYANQPRECMNDINNLLVYLNMLAKTSEDSKTANINKNNNQNLTLVENSVQTVNKDEL